MQNGLVFFFFFLLNKDLNLTKVWVNNSENIMCEKVCKSAETILPFSCGPLVFL